ncbi:WD repeat-containing protein 91 [Goodea atripinnis]|uniref:WD repeat-containing protein 91 n=1 Tax=Goodea atripinnis TaxID=208336 RepID=A0ABV0NBQ0_9TELE
MGSAVERTDKHVREYLIYRGFTGTLKQLDSDIKADKEKGFRVDRIIDQLQQLVQSFDLSGLKEYWLHLDRRLFCRLEDVYRSTVNKLRTSIYRYYIINTIQKGNLEKTQEFFQKQALELQGQAEWRDWFILPFIPAPEQNPAFSPYFSRQWADTFLVSLHNFLSVLFQCMHILQMKLRLQFLESALNLFMCRRDLVSSQRAISATVTPSRNFFSTFLPQGKRTPVKVPPITVGSSPSQAAVGRKESSVNQVTADV